MKRQNYTGLLIAVLLILVSFTACQTQGETVANLDLSSNQTPEVQHSSGDIYLYGEAHGVKVIYDEELKAWKAHYEEGMRDLLIEMPSYTAAYLNEWMKADDDTILDTLYEDWVGTLSHNEDTYAFYQAIKTNCPETVFHGTDVGHQFNTIGKRYLEDLKAKGYDENSDLYQETEEVIEQGKRYYGSGKGDEDHDYRENMMVKNFVKAFDKLEGKPVMGIYGSAHIALDETSFYSDTLPCMANQLNTIYNGQITSTDLSTLVNSLGESYLTEPQSIETITIDGKDYVASYFGSYEINFLEQYKSRKFWRIENAYPDFKDNQTTGDVLPYDNYPLKVEENQVFMIEYTQVDDSTVTFFYRSDAGETYQGMPTTIGFEVD